MATASTISPKASPKGKTQAFQTPRKGDVRAAKIFPGAADEVAPPAQWDARPVLIRLEAEATAATTPDEVMACLQRVLALQEPDPTRADFDPTGGKEHDTWMERWCDVEAGLKEKLASSSGTLPPAVAAFVLDFATGELAGNVEDYASDALTVRMVERVAEDLRSSVLTPDTDAAGVATCAGHRAFMDAVNDAPDGTPDDGPEWRAYEASRDAVSEFRPTTLPGLVAKARAALEEATDKDGSITLASTMGDTWATDILVALVGLPNVVRPAAPDPTPPFAADLVREAALQDAFASIRGRMPPRLERRRQASYGRSDALWGMVAATRPTTPAAGMLRLAAAGRDVNELVNNDVPADEVAERAERIRDLLTGAAVTLRHLAPPVLHELLTPEFPVYLWTHATDAELAADDLRIRPLDRRDAEAAALVASIPAPGGTYHPDQTADLPMAVHS